MEPSMLPPGVTAQEISYRSGRKQVIYTAPYPSEGPVLARDLLGRQAWMFMYAHFVFTWVEGAVQVQVSHGTLSGPKMPLWKGISIPAYWSGPALAEFGRAWALDQMTGNRGTPAAIYL
ncbi:hypothetical protein ED92_29065 [Amycolatopsis sp. MJM2582]|uniref:Uncharacterized protein n=2 Tax=Pseudonocardiaceae TaxID=2070 RepID=A0A075V522_9PSEU|nr:Hypothetical protein AJAP_25840 [Amycolatopsis japonica]KFZ78487.1 hypothetical protein ED92_29065 [Amycolatopsis sp. MJM2582]OKJ96068.1 hypothetical protein AMK34_24140 [Amycolatopsis sp. CB00013]